MPSPKDVVRIWVETFNRADADAIAALYAEAAVNHQVMFDPVVGREAIRGKFLRDFAAAEMVCIPENLFEDGEWAILEWRDPKGLRRLRSSSASRADSSIFKRWLLGISCRSCGNRACRLRMHRIRRSR